MKPATVALIVGVALLWCASPVCADEANMSAKAEELLKLTQSDQMMKQVLEQVKAMQAAQLKTMDLSDERRAQFTEMQERLTALVADHLSKAEPELVKIYADTYTEEELDAILAFYKSPAGKAMLEKMPVVMKRSTPVMMKMMTDLQPEMNKIMDEIKQMSK
jgi:hypothetical protein